MKTNSRVLLLATLVVVLCGGTWHVGAVSGDPAAKPRPAGFDAFVASVRRGGLASLSATRLGDAPERATATVRSLEALALERGGVSLPEAATARLVVLERGYAAGEVGTIDRRRLAASLTDWILDDVLQTATAGEIEQAIDEARIPDSPELPQAFRSGRESLRIDAVAPTLLTTPMGARDAIRQARSSAELRAAVRSEVERRIRGRIDERLDYLQAADSSRFRAAGLTPVEVATLVYSLAATDPLAGDVVELEARMTDLRAAIVARHGSYPSWEGRKAYGPGGYLSAGATSAFMSRIDGLLDRLYG